MMKIILTRHGRTVENDAGILQWHLPGKLNETGLMQAEKVALRLQNETIHHIYSSDLDRAAHTAQTIAQYHPSVPLEYSTEIRETNLGEWQGKTKMELGMIGNPEAEAMSPKEWETRDDVRARARVFLSKIREKHSNDTVLLVGHDGVNRRIIEVLTGTLTDEAQKNTSISLFEITGDEVKVLIRNDVSHLDE